MTKWFNKEWYKYLFAKKDPYWSDEVSWFTVLQCRYKGHPYGVVYYNATGLEPDYHCKNCGDDLG